MRIAIKAAIPKILKLLIFGTASFCSVVGAMSGVRSEWGVWVSGSSIVVLGDIEKNNNEFPGLGPGIWPHSLSLER